MVGAASAARAQPLTTLFLVRHGDRFDYQHPEQWAASAKQHGFEERDPPLSALGHKQARETADAVVKATGGNVDHILASPYLRVLQTAQPLAHALGVPIKIEEGLAETGHVPGSIPPPSARYPFLPEVALDWDSHEKIVPTGRDPRSGRANEAYPLDYLRRMTRMARHLPERYDGQTIVCFTHAASVALVAALLRVPVVEAGHFAPCGIFKLTLDQSNGQWAVDMHGGDNSGHISENAPSTYPWGFEHSRWPVREQWEQVTAEAGIELPCARSGAGTR